VTSTEPSSARPVRPGVPGTGPEVRRERFRDELIRPFLTITTIVITAVQLPSSRVVDPTLVWVMFVVVSALAITSLLPWTRLSARQQVALMATYAVLAAVLLPLAHKTSVDAAFAYLASGVAGARLASRWAAIGIAVTGAVTASVATSVVNHLVPMPDQWPWWIALTVGLPVYVGTANRDRVEAVLSARRAAAEAQRAAESEAREAALVERSRIAREIHDVLGHSLSGIALQLEMADALDQSGRREEAAAAVRRARALAVDSIGETRRAVHALREDTLPLPETLALLATGEEDSFEVVGEAAEVGVEAAHALVRAAQEALTNAAKHAPGADRAMTLTCTEATLCLTVRNGPSSSPPGSPFNAADTEGTGMGLVGMRERAALLGGTLRAGPNPDGGWTVEMEVPR
jgi:signal transduction histidine kinase